MTSVLILIGVVGFSLLLTYVCIALWIGKEGERAAKRDLKEWY